MLTNINFSSLLSIAISSEPLELKPYINIMLAAIGIFYLMKCLSNYPEMCGLEWPSELRYHNCHFLCRFE